MTRQTPRQHIVKEHRRDGRSVHSYSRGKVKITSSSQKCIPNYLTSKIPIIPHNYIGEYSLTSGNCGIYAVALNRVLGNVGKYIATVEENEPEYLSHVALEVGGKLYDASGRITRKEMRDYGKNEDYPRQMITIGEVSEEEALTDANSMFAKEVSVDEIEKLIRNRGK
jgi:hypothetical protein